MSAPAKGSALEVLERLLGQARGAAREAEENATDYLESERLRDMQADLGAMLTALREGRGVYL